MRLFKNICFLPRSVLSGFSTNHALKTQFMCLMCDSMYFFSTLSINAKNQVLHTWYMKSDKASNVQVCTSCSIKVCDSKSKILQIVVDTRECNDYVCSLTNMGANIDIQQLSIGDFILSSRCAVERKTRKDFEASIIDGRVFEQAKRLKEAYEKPLLIVEGNSSDSSRLQKSALLGAYASLITDYSLPLFFTKDSNSTCQLLYSIAKYEQISKKNPLRINARKKAHTPLQSQQVIIESLPNVGPKLAKTLILHFKTPKNIFNATQKELEMVDGVGKIRAKLIFDTINSVFLDKNEY